MKKYKKGLTMLLVVATVLSVIVGSLAYFTDRVSSTATATAGTLDLALSTPAVTPTTGLKPGTGASIKFTLTNNGNKSADVLETIVLTVTDSNGNALPMSATSEFDLYMASDVDLVNGVATIKSGKNPIAARSYTTGSNKITYAIPEFILNGTGTGAEKEDGVTSNAKASDYVLVFRTSAGNKFQGAKVTLDYEAQAKQHRNTNATTWSTIQTVKIAFAGDANHMAVPTAPAS